MGRAADRGTRGARCRGHGDSRGQAGQGVRRDRRSGAPRPWRGAAARQVRSADEERVSPLRADRLMQLELNGETLNYVKEGRGPAIVFIHFIGGFSGPWRHHFAALQERYTCIAFDTRGFGFSTYNGRWDAAAAAADVRAGLEALGVDPAPIVPLSNGGAGA